jgi:outer membrane protein OmpA-like peptidoglycan-associated protein
MRLRAFALLACGAATCLLLIACGLLDEQGRHVPESRPAIAGRTTVRISQLGYGQDARFATCAPPACPTVTTKVIASASDPERAATPLSTQTAVGFRTADAGPASVVREGNPQVGREARAEPRRLTLQFGTNAARLTLAHKALIDAAFSELRRSDVIVIAGRTDDVGSESANQALALARGLAVRDHLLDLDPNLSARIAIDAKGRCCYAAPNDSVAARARNRRVEIAGGPTDGRLP